MLNQSKDLKKRRKEVKKVEFEKTIKEAIFVAIVLSGGTENTVSNVLTAINSQAETTYSENEGLTPEFVELLEKYFNKT